MEKESFSTQKMDQLLGQKVSALRQIRKLSGIQLGRLLGVSYQQLSKYEKGINRISATKLILIAKALGTTPEYFYKELPINESGDTLTVHQQMWPHMSENLIKICPSHLKILNELIDALAQKKCKTSYL